MKFKLSALALGLLLVAACDKSATTSPATDPSAVLAFDVAATLDSATLMPRGLFMDATPPDSIKLTDAQTAAIKALHDAFAAAHATQFAQIKAIHEAARAAHKAGKTRLEVMIILSQSWPIMLSMQPDFAVMRAQVAAILTPAQKQWRAAHQRKAGGPMGLGFPSRP